MSDINEYIEFCKEESVNHPLGFHMHVQRKMVKHVNNRNAHSLITYLTCYRIAFPSKHFNEIMSDEELAKDIGSVVNRVYKINKDWKQGDDINTMWFRKVS